MRHGKRLIALAVVLYLALSIAGIDGAGVYRIIGRASAHSTESLIIRTLEGEVTVGRVRVNSGEQYLSVTLSVDEPYEIYSSAVTLRLNEGDIIRALSSRGRDTYLAQKTSRIHSYNIPIDQVKGDSVQVAASAVIPGDRIMYQTPKVFVNVAGTTTTTCSSTTSTSPSATSTTQPTNEETTTPSSSTTTTSSTTSTTNHGGGGTTSTTSHGGGATTTVSPSGGATTTTTIAVVAGATTSTTIQEITDTTAIAVTTDTTVAGRRAVPKRTSLPFTGLDLNWYMIGFLLMAIGASVYLIAAGEPRRREIHIRDIGR